MSRRVVVLGGGVSGLASAWNLARRGRGREVVLLEAAERVGGWIRSEVTPPGAVLEQGPRSLRTAGQAGKATLGLVSALGLSDEVLPVLPSHKGAKRRFIYTNKNGLLEIPSGPSWLFRAKPPFTRPLLPALIAEPFRKQRSGEEREDESVHSFISRRLNTELADFLIDPMCRGIFAGNCHKLSMRSSFPLIYQYEQQHGSIVRGALFAKKDPSLQDPPLVQRAVKEKWQIYTLKRGLEAFPEALRKALVELGVKMVTKQPCTGITFNDGTVKVTTEQDAYEVDHIVSAIPSFALAPLLPSSHSPLSDLLSAIPTVTVGVVCLEYKGQPLPEQYKEAFGYLVPSHQKSKILGIVFDSATFPEHDRRDTPSTRVTVMLGGDWFEELFGRPEEADIDDITEAALEALQDHLGVRQTPSCVRTVIHRNCIPQYTLGHGSRIDSIFGYVSAHRLPLTLVGSSYRGVSVNDCVFHALQATDEL